MIDYETLSPFPTPDWPVHAGSRETNNIPLFMLGSNSRRKKWGAQEIHLRGEGAPAREAHENSLPPPVQLPGSSCMICQKF